VALGVNSFYNIMQQAFQHIHNSLSGIYDDSEIRNISFLLLEKLTGFSRTQLLTNKSTIFSFEQRQEFEGFVEKLKKNTPIQYVLGETEFYGLRFAVDESVLIPRPETEELVEWIKNDCKNSASLQILDVGTGSGCIAVSLKNELPFVEITAFDVSENTLETARKNAEQNDLQVDFQQIDILQENRFSQKWDIIVSNPPYIPEKERMNMQKNVREHEPSIALFVPDETPLLFYEKIAQFAQNHLTDNGKLYFEIHFDAGKSVMNLLRSLNFKNIELRKDLSGNDRMVRAEI